MTLVPGDMNMLGKNMFPCTSAILKYVVNYTNAAADCNADVISI